MSARNLTRYILATALLSAVLPLAHAEMKLGTERIAGRGTRGPYMLALQGIEPRSEQVFRNGIRLEAGRDFLLDPTMGMLSFTDPLRPTDSVEIRYGYDTTKAKAPGPTAGTFGLFGGNSGGLALNYSFRPDAKGNQALSNLGFNGQAEFGANTLTTNFMMDKTASPKAGREAQNMQFGLKSDKGRLKYDLGYERVGNQFTPAEAMKLLKGSEALNLSASLQFSGSGQLSFKKTDNTTPDAKKGTLQAALEQAGLSMDLAQGSHLTALHERQSQSQGGTTTESAVDRLQLDQKLGGNGAATLVQETVSNAKNGQGETVEATRLNTTMTGSNGLKVETALALTDSDKKGNARDAGLKVQSGDGPTKMTLAVTDRKADAGDLQTHALGFETSRGVLKFNAALVGDKSDTANNETGTLGVEGKVSENLQFAAGLASYSGVNKSGTGTRLAVSGKGAAGMSFAASRADDYLDKGDKSATNLSLDLAGIKRFKLSASMKDDTMGAKPIEAQRLNIEANPLDALKLVATHASDVNEKGDVANTRLAMEATAGKGARLSASHDISEKDNVSKESTGVNLEANPNQAVKVRASMLDSKDDKGTGQVQAFAIEAQPLQTMKVSASMSDGKATSGDTAMREAAISMTPVKDRLSFGGSVRQEEKGAIQTQVLVAQADMKPSDALGLKGFYKQRGNGSAEQINTVDAQFTLKTPNDFLQMVGTFSQNPEEKDKILRLVRRGLTLQSTLGSLTFSGGYVTEQSLIDDAEGAHTEFKLGLRFSRYAQLTGGFQQTVGAIRGYKPMLAYNVKYDHNIGSDFHLLLQGDVVERDNTVPAAQREEVKGTANLGIRF